MADVLQRTFWSNSYWEWGLACAVALVAALAIMTARRIAHRNHARLARTERVELMEVPLQVLSKTGLLFVTTLAVYAGLATLELPGKVDRFASTALTLVLFWQLGVWTTTRSLPISSINERRR